MIKIMPTLKAIGEQHNISIARVALRLLIERGVFVIPNYTEIPKRSKGVAYAKLMIDHKSV